MYYSIARFCFVIYYNLLYKIKITGHENVPKTGGRVVCSNHVCVDDPMVIAAVFKRPIHFIGKRELFGNKFFAWVLKKIHAIPVDRDDVGMSTFKKAVKVLKDGNLLGIFAQGRREDELDSKNAKAGVALFALKAQVPIIPVGIRINKGKVRGEIIVNIGKPISLDEYKDKKVRTEGLNLITENIMESIKKLC